MAQTVGISAAQLDAWALNAAIQITPCLTTHAAVVTQPNTSGAHPILCSEICSACAAGEFADRVTARAAMVLPYRKVASIRLDPLLGRFLPSRPTWLCAHGGAERVKLQNP